MVSGGTRATGRWFQSSRPLPDAAARIFAFPHAGGSAPNYTRWSGLLPGGVELQVAQLPGRQDRRTEPAFTRLDPLIEALYDALDDELDGRPFAFFGHSMGALLAYRLTVAMERDGGPRPALLAVSGWAPAAHRTSPVPVADYSDDEFLDIVSGFGALPPEVAGNAEMRQLVLPALRGDFSVLNSYAHDGARLQCPVVAYGGSSDPGLPPGTMDTWSALSARFLGAREFPGGHFYLFEHALSVSADLTRQLERCLTDRAVR